MTDRDAQPAAAEGADTIRSRAFEFALYALEGEFPDEMEDVIRRAVTIGVDYGLGDAAAPREGGVVGAVLRELEWRHWSTRDGSERMCLLCERDESEGHAPECRMAAAIEAARGEG